MRLITAAGVIGLFVVLAFALFGCSSLVPNSVRPEVEHLSHISEHRPFTDAPNTYDANLVNLIAHWDIHRAYVEIGEGVALNRSYPQQNSYGEILGPREQFTLRVGYVIQVRQ